MKNNPKKKKPVVIWEQDLDVRFFGRFPYRFKLRKIMDDVWNPKERRLFPPKQFGIGWGINFYVLYDAYQKVKKQVKKL